MDGLVGAHLILMAKRIALTEALDERAQTQTHRAWA